MAEQMWPCWVAGMTMLYLVKNSSHSDLLRVDKAGLLKFAKLMLAITAIRFVVLKFLTPDMVLEQAKAIADMIPLPATLGVFWEDACHTLPLALAALLYSKDSWYRVLRIPMLLIVMLAFGSGHIYQGMIPAILLSFYIPFTLKLAKKYGFGTVMLCHMAYDLITLCTIKYLV